MQHATFKRFTGSKAISAFTLVIALTCGSFWLLGQDPTVPDDPTGNVALTAAVDDAHANRGPSNPKGERLSDAERVARLERTIESDRHQLEQLKQLGDDPDGEYRVAEAEFKHFDELSLARRKQIQELRRAGRQDEANELTAQDLAQRGEWQAAKDRFDLAIQQRKTLREKAEALANKIDQDTVALTGLIGAAPGAALEAPAAEPNMPSQLTAETVVEPKANEPAPANVAEAVAEALAAPVTRANSQRSARRALEVAQAQKEADLRQAAARDADDHAASINERFEALRKNIGLEEQLLEIARAKADQAQTARTNLNAEMQKKLVEDPASLETVWGKITDAEKRYIAARDEVRQVQDRLDSLRSELGGLQDEHITALGNAKQLNDEANLALGRLDRLQNPFTLTNITQWFLDHGPKLLTILIGTLILSLFVKFSGRQIAQVVARTGSRGTLHDRENRALTLVNVFRNTASLVLLGGGLLMLLDEVGIPIGPLMGGAAVFGLAVAFGAQNLIRDYFSGFMVLLEDQYGIGDVVRIGDVSGAVEKLTLRMTVLRDMEGAMHFIPHGSITRVTNMTHGWSRAVLDVGVAYKEDADRVMGVLTDIGKEIRTDPQFGPMILDGPEMLGVEDLGDSAVVIRFFLKTQPLQRWPVRRELLRRVKRTFDQMGIEIPFPQRTIHHRYDEGFEPSDAPESHPRDSNAAR